MADGQEPQTQGAEESPTLTDRILAVLPELSRKQQRIARFILNNQEFVAFASAADVAARTRSSAATVVRCCQTLGYRGYIQLQLHVREGISFQRTALQRLEARLAAPVPREDVLSRVFATDIANIERTAVLTAADRLQAAVATLRAASRILVLGDGLAAGLATYLSHAFQVIGLPAQGVVGGGEPLGLALAFLQPEDVVVAIGFWRNLADIVRAVNHANDIGAQTIGITDNRLSPLARLTTYPFLVATDSVAHGLSPVATVSLLNAFVAALSFEIPDQVVDSLQRVEKAYRRNDLLME
jgi:DNA-binding MurR/RpiR family transcriptional regulator